MKKITKLILAIAMLGFLVVGCGDGGIDMSGCSATDMKTLQESSPKLYNIMQTESASGYRKVHGISGLFNLGANFNEDTFTDTSGTITP